MSREARLIVTRTIPEPALELLSGLLEQDNVVLVPHRGSATRRDPHRDGGPLV